MHPEAFDGFSRSLTASGVDPDGRHDVLDIGGQDVNGSVHALLPFSSITTLDLENADIIADATTWRSDQRFDLVIATEVFEHVKDWRAVVATMRAHLQPGGVLVATCASTARQRHGATGAPEPAEGEHYGNVHPDDLRVVLRRLFREYDVEYQYPPGDAYMWARA